MPLEYCFRLEIDGRIEEIDLCLLEPGERSGLYPDYSSGEKQLIGLRCDEEDVCSVETFASEGILDTDAQKVIAEEDLPLPFARILVGPKRPHEQAFESDDMCADLVARYKPVGEISVGGGTVIIPNSLNYPN